MESTVGKLEAVPETASAENSNSESVPVVPVRTLNIGSDVCVSEHIWKDRYWPSKGVCEF